METIELLLLIRRLGGCLTVDFFIKDGCSLIGN